MKAPAPLGCLTLIGWPFRLLYLLLVRPEHARYLSAEWRISRAFRRGKWAKAERLSYEYLALAERVPRDWNYGNAIHDANQVLGLIRLRQGELEQAKEYLLRAGLSPGSPQLNSFGPTMALARELLQCGEKLVVLEYVDRVARFWLADKPHYPKTPEHRQHMEGKRQLVRQWRLDIAEGRVPDYYLWRGQV